MSRAWTVAMAVLAAGLAEAQGLREPGAEVVAVATNFGFTEGPAADAAGHVFFTDIPRSTIHRWDAVSGAVTVWTTNSGGANGLYFDAQGRLLACEGDRKRVVAWTPDGRTSTVLTATYAGAPFNQPNDLWVAPNGGIYFSDPNYSKQPDTQDAEGVYYLAPGTNVPVRVISDFQKPNGLIGTPDGRTLYATDIAARKTWKYAIQPDGTLADKQLFCERGSDGMALDADGRVYLTDRGVAVFEADGRLLEVIALPQAPANVTFGGADGRTLFMTARTAVYTLRMAVAGAATVVQGASRPPALESAPSVRESSR